MSCRSTPFTSAVTSYAKFMTPYFSDSQTQSMYHELKQQSEESPHEPCDAEAFHSSIEGLSYKIRNDDALSDAKRESLLSRLEQARAGGVINAKSWAAAQRLEERVGVARVQYESILDSAGSAFMLDRGDMHKIIMEARGGTWMNSGSFIDYYDYPEEFRFDLTEDVPQDESTLRALRKVGYETFLAQKYPVFVYGTLRTGMGNHRVMSDGTERFQSGLLKGVGIYGADRGFPYAAEHPDAEAVTVGEIHWMKNDVDGDTARLAMDWLEGFNSNNPRNSHYERKRVSASIKGSNGETSQVECWSYFARGSAKSQLREEDRIKHGDWVEARAELRLQRTLREQLLGLG